MMLVAQPTTAINLRIRITQTSIFPDINPEQHYLCACSSYNDATIGSCCTARALRGTCEDRDEGWATVASPSQSPAAKMPIHCNCIQQLLKMIVLLLAAIAIAQISISTAIAIHLRARRSRRGSGSNSGSRCTCVQRTRATMKACGDDSKRVPRSWGC